MEFFKMEMSRVQMLYNLCNNVFAQKDLPTFQQIQTLKKLLDTFEPTEVGIDGFSLPDSPVSIPISSRGLICGQGVSEITYIHIHESDCFSIRIFCFPAGATFPLHDHPGMTVLSKLLYGSVRVKAYDWLKVETYDSRTRVAGTVMDGVLRAPCETRVLFPRSGGNIHSFTALTPCAIMDVLSPPYSDDHGRPSTYFSEFPLLSLPGYAVLEERELSEDLVVIGAPYVGPCIHFSVCKYKL